MNKKLELKCTCFAALLLCLLLVTVSPATPGRLDPAFGNGGKAITNFTSVSDHTRRLEVQADGKILVLTTIGMNATRIPAVASIRRFLPNGDPDLSFGVAGSILGSNLRDFTVLPDGRIIGVFTQYTSGGATTRVQGFTANGQLDPTFGVGGSTTIASQNGIAEGRRIQNIPDGTIVVIAATETPTLIARLRSDGSMDATFGTNGVAYGHGIGYSYLITNDDLTTDAVGDLLIQPDGKIIYGLHGEWNDSYYLVRIDANGSADTSFGLGGVARMIVGGYVYTDTIALGMVLLPNGKLIVSGASVPWNFMAGSFTGISRLNSDGTLDPTFGSGGRMILDSPATDFRGASSSLNVLPSGRILLGGMAGQNYAVTRLLPDGSIDTSFGTNGQVQTPMGSIPGYNSILAAVVQSDNKMLTAGVAQNASGTRTLGLARYADIDLGRSSFDFDGDAKTDISVFRPSNVTWYLDGSQTGSSTMQFGLSNDTLTPADLDADGKTDIGVFRDGIWYWLNSSTGNFSSIQFGLATDIPVPADFSGDGRSELAVYRNGTWWKLDLTNGQINTEQFGTSTDRPVPADYDGDGKADIAIYRPSNGQWWMNRSAAGLIVHTFGNNLDRTVPGDYTGDGKADVAIWRPSNGEWFVLRSEDASFYSFPFGSSTDLPVPGDYDGDGKFDAGLFRPSNATWYLNRSTNGILIQGFGLPTDIPVPAAFVR